MNLEMMEKIERQEMWERYQMTSEERKKSRRESLRKLRDIDPDTGWPREKPRKDVNIYEMDDHSEEEYLRE